MPILVFFLNNFYHISIFTARRKTSFTSAVYAMANPSSRWFVILW